MITINLDIVQLAAPCREYLRRWAADEFIRSHSSQAALKEDLPGLIDAAPMLTDEVRAEAHNQAKHYANDPVCLYGHARQTVLHPLQNLSDYRLALWRAQYWHVQTVVVHFLGRVLSGFVR